MRNLGACSHWPIVFYTKLFGAGLDHTLCRSVLLAKIALIRQLQEYSELEGRWIG